MQHDRRDHAAAAPAPAQGVRPVVAVRAGAPRPALRGLHPGVRLAAAHPLLVQELRDLREVVHRIGLVGGELLLPRRPRPVVHEHPQPPAVPLPHRYGREGPAQRAPRATGRGARRIARSVRGRHGLRQRHHGPQPRTASVAVPVDRHARLTFRTVCTLCTQRKNAATNPLNGVLLGFVDL